MSHGMRRAGFAVALLLVCAAPALAAADGEGGDVAFSKIGWFFRFANFFLLVFLGYRLLRKAPQWFRGRADQIVRSIAESRQIKDEADALLRDSENKLARLDQEVAELRAAARQDGASEAGRIRATAREEEKKIERAAQAEVEAAERAARMELKALAAQLAVARAEGLLREQITPERQAVLVRSFVANLEGLS